MLNFNDGHCVEPRKYVFVERVTVRPPYLRSIALRCAVLLLKPLWPPTVLPKVADIVVTLGWKEARDGGLLAAPLPPAAFALPFAAALPATFLTVFLTVTGFFAGAVFLTAFGFFAGVGFFAGAVFLVACKQRHHQHHLR